MLETMKKHIEPKTKKTDKTSLRNFVLVGRHTYFNEYWISKPLTIIDVINSKYPSFFNGKNFNCDFIMEIYDGDILIFKFSNKTTTINVMCDNDVFFGVDGSETHLLEYYLNRPDFISVNRFFSMN